MQINANVAVQAEIDKCEQIILMLLQIVGTFEMADPVMRQKETELVLFFLTQRMNDELIFEQCIRLLEILMPDLHERMDHIVDLMTDLTTDNIDFMNTHVLAFIESIPNPDLKLELIQCRFDMGVEFENEQEAMNNGEYEQAARLHDGLLETYGKFVERLKQLAGEAQLQEISDANVIEYIQKLTNGKLPIHALRGAMQMSFFVINSKKIRRLTQSMVDFFRVSVCERNRSTRARSLFAQIIDAFFVCFLQFLEYYFTFESQPSAIDSVLGVEE